MHAFIDLVKKRRSIRGYLPKRVPREMLERCLEAARFAPTACNTQRIRFIVTERELKDRLVSECLGGIPVPNRWALQAPVIVVVAAARNFITHGLAAKIKGIQYDLIDAGIAGQHFVLQATELGLGTCWLGWFKKRKVRKLLKLPLNWDISAMITVGFSDTSPSDIRNSSLDEIREYRS